MRGILERIVGVSLRTKLIGGFIALIGLTAIAGTVSMLSQYYARAAINKLIDVDDKIGDLSLKSVTSIYKARRNEKDFLLQYRKLGFNDARARYVSLLQVQVADICGNMAAILQLTDDPDLVQKALAVQEVVRRYESGFLFVVELFGRLGHVKTGLEGGLRLKIHEVEAILDERRLDRLLIDVLSMRRAEKDYLLRGIEIYAGKLQEIAVRFRADLVPADLPLPLQEKLLTLSGEYTALFEEYVQTNREIASGMDAYLTTVHLVEPLLEELYAKASEAEDATRGSVSYTASRTLKIIGCTGLASILLGVVVAFFVSRGISDGVRSCMDFAERVARGDLETRMVRGGRDEFATLAASLNKMTDALLDSRLSRERRGIELAEANKALQEEIAERRRTEEEHSRLATAVEQAAEGIIITDRKGRITYVNPAFCRVSGYTREELVDLNFRIFKSSKHDESFYRAMWNTISGGGLWTGHITNKTKDGGLCEFETVISPIRDSAGAVISFVSVNRDVTQEVKLERQLRQAQKMESIGTLAGGIAHDFNNILGIIFGYTDLALLDSSDGSTVQSNLQEVQKAAHRAKDLVRQILAFSRQSEQERSLMQVGPIVKETLKLLKAALPATIEIRRQTDTLPHGADIVMADPTQIHQVIMNLCTNAGHAMREKGGLLEVSLSNVELGPHDLAPYADLNPGPYLRLSVKDTGHGMDQAVLERIFEPYFTTKGIGEGTGLGLAVVHGIVKSHGGAITAYSKPGEGSLFHVYLPGAGGEITAEKTDSELLARGSETILFVDDEPGLVDAGRKALEHLGYKVVSRTGSIEASGAFRAQPDKFDLVITDLSMPQMTGLELARELLRIRPDIPIILCTGFSEMMLPERAKSAGIRELLFKPLIIADLSNTVRRVLDKDGKRSEA